MCDRDGKIRVAVQPFQVKSVEIRLTHYFIGVPGDRDTKVSATNDIIYTVLGTNGCFARQSRLTSTALRVTLRVLQVPEELNTEIFSMSNDLNKENKGHDANLDPLSGEPGAHPVGTGVGAAGAGAVGAAIGGAIGGPVGAVVGAVVGSVGGGLAGKEVAERIDPTVEDAYWRDNYTSRPYVESDYTYDDYAPAYRTGYESFARHVGTGKTYDEVEPELRRDYESSHGNARLGWEKAKHASRDAWNRVERAIPGDADHDGR
jgi:hypothetical protein